MIQLITGIIVAVAIILLSELLKKYFTYKLVAATILVAIAFIYVGFSLKDNTAQAVIFETAIAMLFYFLALTGYKKNNSLLGYGILTHGLWDLLHHHSIIIGTDVPGYWPAFCFVVDIIDGVYFLFIFKLYKNPVAEKELQFRNQL